jgi:hypothetical protein
MADAARDNFNTLPKSLKKLDAEQISDFCGQCHRTWDTVMRNKWHGPAFVRFQPYRLENSRCFIGNDARISCLACHNPHQPVKHDTAYYDTKCLACHAGAKSDQTNGTAKTCPVAKSNCSSCHMPKVELGGHPRCTCWRNLPRLIFRSSTTLEIGPIFLLYLCNSASVIAIRYSACLFASILR